MFSAIATDTSLKKSRSSISPSLKPLIIPSIELLAFIRLESEASKLMAVIRPILVIDLERVDFTAQSIRNQVEAR